MRSTSSPQRSSGSRHHRFAPMLNETTRGLFHRIAPRRRAERRSATRCARWLANPDDGAAADAIEASELEVGLDPHPLRRDHARGRPCRQCVAADRPRPTSIAGSSRASTPAASAGRARGDRRTQGQGRRRSTPASRARASPLRADVVAAYTARCAPARPGDADHPPHVDRRHRRLLFPPGGIPVYGVDGSWGIIPDDERAHGLDERLPVRAFYDDVVHWENDDPRLARRG